MVMEWSRHNDMEFLNHGSPWPYPLGDGRETNTGSGHGTPVSAFFRSATTGTLGPDDKIMDRYVSSIRRSMSSSEVRMTPRPAKTPAWSVPPLMSSPMDDPSSCSDNASDNSDKIESLCSATAPAHHSSSPTTKNRKRKMGNSFSPPAGNGSEVKDDHGSGNHSHNNTTQQASLWQEADSLAADFDGSLSGLGADLSTTSYDMSEALLALPSLYHQRNSSSAGNANAQQQQQQTSNNGATTGYISMKEAGLTPLAAAHLHGGSSVSLPGDFHFEPHSTSPLGANGGNMANGLDCERRFQYVLAAATSIATKVNEETLTYLNQGQPYEIKLKKLGELTAYRGVVFRSVVRLCFHDRRLQFSEREQIAQWEDSHMNDRILQVDLPLSYGVTMLPHQTDIHTNTVSFLWEPLKEVGLYVKVNCISTEFTPKKHGGEKGVPFRMMIETYSHPDNVRLHASACQVKVFKLKGADRKHKQDREKILKKTPGEQAKLQPSYECTVLSDISLESLDSPPSAMQNGQSQTVSPSYTSDHGGCGGESPESFGHSAGGPTPTVTTPSSSYNYFSAHFSPESVRRWLLRNRFGSTKTLWDYSGLDLLRLSKEELVEMCGLAEGIRLYNALHYKITFYVTLSGHGESNRGGEGSGESSSSSTIFHPVCLSSPSIPELVSVLGSLFHTLGQGDFSLERLFLNVHGHGSSRLRVTLTEQLLSTLKDQTAFKASKHGNEASLEIVD